MAIDQNSGGIGQGFMDFVLVLISSDFTKVAATNQDPSVNGVHLLDFEMLGNKMVSFR